MSCILTCKTCKTAKTDLRRTNLFQPAPYLRTPYNQLALLKRIRTQVTGYIASHLHFDKNHIRIPYDERHCPLCLPQQTVGDELHTIVHCPHSSPTAQPTTLELTKTLRLLDLWSWATYDPLQKLGMLLGSLPPSIQRKNKRQWTLLTTPLCIQFSHQI